MAANNSEHGMARRAVRVLIQGRVQGVGYRAWTEYAAIALGLKGWVRNRRDGSVEALFAGSAERVSEMVERCRQGPRSAAVKSVTVSEETADGLTGFTVLPTA
jgi:acylphosphatase